MPARRDLRLVVVLVLAGVSASCGGRAGTSEQAFCDAVQAGDAATAQALPASAGFDVWARNARGDCQP